MGKVQTQSFRFQKNRGTGGFSFSYSIPLQLAHNDHYIAPPRHRLPAVTHTPTTAEQPDSCVTTDNTRTPLHTPHPTFSDLLLYLTFPPRNPACPQAGVVGNLRLRSFTGYLARCRTGEFSTWRTNELLSGRKLGTSD